uniref:Putative tumor necrosis factor receptor n=1 Tax=Amblyomma triste TaxID=251400 RepID=A0A023G7T4_AMBTT
MAPENTQYTLVGFSTDLDWRPLCFVKPIPTYRVCGACGLVRKSTALLPCSHTLCESCYEHSAKDGVRVCPLDGHRCEVEDVDLKEFPIKDLQRREVKCWNEASGCRAVLSASAIAQHFQRECRHHCVRCPKCSATVLCSDVCAHLESERCSAATTAARGCRGDSDSSEEMTLGENFKAILEQQAGEIKTLLGRLLTTSDANSDRLNEIGHSVNNSQESIAVLKQAINGVAETVQQEAVQVRTETRDYAKKCSDEITAFREEEKERFIAGSDTMNAISNAVQKMEKQLREEIPKAASKQRDNDSQTTGVLEGAAAQPEESNNAMCPVDHVVPRPPDPYASACEFIVKGIKSLQKRAQSTVWVEYKSERAYLRGYSVSPGIAISYCGHIKGVIWLHKGDMDDVVQWPFKTGIKFTALHPKRGMERLLLMSKPGWFVFERPQEEREKHEWWDGDILPLKELIHDGYVEDDQLLVKFELLP